MVPYTPEELEQNVFIFADGKTKLQALGACTIRTVVENVQIEDVQIEDVAKVVEVANPADPEAQSPLIIGQNTLQRFEMQLRHAEGGKDRLQYFVRC